jgi:fructose-1-phosphate kinase PfkB-like protein
LDFIESCDCTAEINTSNIDQYLRKANSLGIENILVSLGKDGAVLSNAQGIHKLN